MEHNIGKNGRLWRLVGGAMVLVIGLIFAYATGFGLLVAAEAGYAVLGWLLVAAGAALLLEGAFAFDVVNAVLKRNTCSACQNGVTHKHMPV